jgi:hypothetical protein
MSISPNTITLISFEPDVIHFLGIAHKAAGTQLSLATPKTSEVLP